MEQQASGREDSRHRQHGAVMSAQHTPGPLEDGQCSLDDLVTIERAHDVRTLRGCAHCGGLGHKYNMIDGSAVETKSTPWYHGRCFAAKYGEDELLKLGRVHLDRLCIGDIGTRLMKLVMSRYHAAIAKAVQS
jgi:hypothetical protein